MMIPNDTPITASFLSTLPARGATALGCQWGQPRQDFYPRSPRGERPSASRGELLNRGFLSTLPARGATQLAVQPRPSSSISIHAPREGSDPQLAVQPRPSSSISIHAPREGSDTLSRTCSPLRHISIHAPREGSDLPQYPGSRFLCYFYPRSPRGERPTPNSSALKRWQNFYPRSPRGERRGSEPEAMSRV